MESEWREWRASLWGDGYRVSFGGDENGLRLVAHLYKYSKATELYTLKWGVSCLNKVICLGEGRKMHKRSSAHTHIYATIIR